MGVGGGGGGRCCKDMCKEGWVCCDMCKEGGGCAVTCVTFVISYSGMRRIAQLAENAR